MANLNRIKVSLVERNKTGKWLAEKMGISTVTVSKWCTNSSQPDLETLYKIADLLHLDIRDLLVGNRNTDD
jgi:putative transcriptional regulator